MSVVTLRIPPRNPLTPAEEFHHARRAMVRAFSAWLDDGPDPGEVRDEVDGTGSVLTQLLQLAEARNG